LFRLNLLSLSDRQHLLLLYFQLNLLVLFLLMIRYFRLNLLDLFGLLDL